MGLAERRRIAAITQEADQAAQTFEKNIGLGITLQLDTTTFPEETGVLDSYDYYKEYGLPAITRIFEDLTKDKLGKEAVQAHIKTVKVINTSKNGADAGEKAVTLANGELLIKFGFYNYSDKVWDENNLRQEIENLI